MNELKAITASFRRTEREYQQEISELTKKLKERDIIIAYLRESKEVILKNTLPKELSDLFIAYICSYYKLSREQLKYDSRFPEIMSAKKTLSYFLNKYFGFYGPEIAKIFNHKYHSTVYVWIRDIEQLADIDLNVYKEFIDHRIWLDKLNKLNENRDK